MGLAAAVAAGSVGRWVVKTAEASGVADRGMEQSAAALAARVAVAVAVGTREAARVATRAAASPAALRAGPTVENLEEG